MSEPTEAMREEARKQEPGWGPGGDAAYQEGFAAGMAHAADLIAADKRAEAEKLEALAFPSVMVGARALREEAAYVDSGAWLPTKKEAPDET